MDPSGGAELSPRVREAIARNRKIEAIKLLRAERGLDLKDAKQLVEAYAAKNVHRTRPGRTGEESGLGRIILALILIAIGYLVFRSLT